MVGSRLHRGSQSHGSQLQFTKRQLYAEHGLTGSPQHIPIRLWERAVESTCFYITPIGGIDSEQRKHSDLFRGTLIESALASFGPTVVRADQIDKPGMITKQIMEYLVKSRLVIVDLSFHNPNVFYELAIRHMMRLPIVQIVRKLDPIPFDVNQLRTVIIDTSDIYAFAPRISTYQADISSHVRRALDDADSVETPISTFFQTLRATGN